MIEVNIINKSTNELPKYAKKGDAGMDLSAELSTIKEKFMYGAAMDEIRNVLLLFPGGRVLIPTENYMAIPDGYQLEIRPRSGLALKNGISVLNTPGTIDAGYRNSIGVVLINHGREVFEITQGDKIAQGVFMPYVNVTFNVVESLDETERGLGGFGSTSIKA